MLHLQRNSMHSNFNRLTHVQYAVSCAELLYSPVLSYQRFMESDYSRPQLSYWHFMESRL